MTSVGDIGLSCALTFLKAIKSKAFSTQEVEVNRD